MTQEAIAVATAHVRIQGEYKCVLNQGTERETSTGWMRNLVTDRGLDSLGSSSFGLGFGQSPLEYISVGSGTVAPAASDTSLGAYIFGAPGLLVRDSQVNLGAPTYAGQFTLHYTFPKNSFTGNITEIGLGTSPSGANLFSRTLVVDNSGTPTALTVTSTDQLTIYYRLTCSPSLADSTGTVSLSGTSYGFTARIAQAASFLQPNTVYMFTSSSAWPGADSMSSAWFEDNATLGAVTSTVSGTPVTPSQVGPTSTPAYVLGRFYQDVSMSWGPALANSLTSGLRGIEVHFGNSLGSWQWVFSTPIPKNNTKTLTLVFRFSWGR